jgi:hypothetical protein
MYQSQMGAIDELATQATQVVTQPAAAVPQVPGWYTLRRMARMARGFRRYFFAGMLMTVGK